MGRARHSVRAADLNGNGVQRTARPTSVSGGDPRNLLSKKTVFCCLVSH
jgi:hypothetical protein